MQHSDIIKPPLELLFEQSSRGHHCRIQTTPAWATSSQVWSPKSFTPMFYLKPNCTSSARAMRCERAFAAQRCAQDSSGKPESNQTEKCLQWYNCHRLSPGCKQIAQNGIVAIAWSWNSYELAFRGVSTSPSPSKAALKRPKGHADVPLSRSASL